MSQRDMSQRDMSQRDMCAAQGLRHKQDLMQFENFGYFLGFWTIYYAQISKYGHYARNSSKKSGKTRPNFKHQLLGFIFSYRLNLKIKKAFLDLCLSYMYDLHDCNL